MSCLIFGSARHHGVVGGRADCLLCGTAVHDPACAVRWPGWRLPQPRQPSGGNGGPIDPLILPREDRAEMARRWRAEGLTWVTIGERLGGIHPNNARTLAAL